MSAATMSPTKPTRMNATVQMLMKGLMITGVTIGVTALGVAAGMFVMSSAIAPQQRMLVLGSAMGLLLLAAAGVWARGEWAARRVKRVRSDAAMPMPAAMRGSNARKQKTPQAVQALAARGAEPMEIAARTGLSLDAVSMVLALGAAR